MNITRVLSVSAIILGLYILFSFLFGRSPHIEDLDPFSKTKQNFHVGCYANDQKLTHSYDIISKIEDLKHKSWIKEKESSLISSDALQKRGVEVARNFQSFISQYSNYKSRSQISHQLTRAVVTAKQNFKNCVEDIFVDAQSFQVECNRDWKLYEKCFGDIDSLKFNLKSELDNKMTVMQKINDFLYQNGEDKLKNSPHDEYMKQFRRKDRILEEQEKRLEAEIKLLYQRISQAQYNYTVAKNKTSNAYYLYSQCSQHRSQFRLCEQLTKETLSLGKNDNIESLGQKVQRKRTAIGKMQQLLNQNSRGQSTSQFRDSYQQYFEDYKRLLKLYVETKAKIRKHCGCSQEQEQKLKQSYLQKKKEEQERLIQHKRFVALYERRKPELEDMKEKRRTLLDQLEARMKKLKNPDHQPVKPGHDSILAQLKKQKQNHELEIMSLNTEFTDLQKQCEKISNRISKRIPEISKMKECLNKYQYYSEIKAKVQKENPKQIKMNEVLKRRLVESVHDFEL